MKTFKEWITESTTQNKKVCYMLSLPDDDQTKLQVLQKSFNIQANEIVQPLDFHATIRFMKTDKDLQPLLDWIDKQKLPVITATIKSFDRLNDAFVAKLESPEMHTWFEKVNSWLVENGYPKSDYDTFLPHISLSYETDPNWETPKFDKNKHSLDLEFNYHYITAKPDQDGQEYKKVWGKESI